jgi:hypothetical protein
LDPDECRCAVGRFDEHDGDLVVVGDLTVGQWRGGMIGQGGLLSRLGPGERSQHPSGPTYVELGPNTVLTATRRDDLQHGTNAAYVSGCVCGECRSHQRVRMVKQRN